MKQSMRTLLKKGFAELVGTWILVFTILNAIVRFKIESAAGKGEYSLICWVHGFAIFVLALIFGPISGGHFNTAVSLAIFLRKQLNLVEFIVYILAQLLGGILAGALNYALFNDWYVTQSSWSTTPLGINLATNMTLTSAFFLEFVGTAMLVVSILVTTDKNNTFLNNNPTAGIGLIASTIAFIGFAGIFYYAGINPARDLGPRIFGSFVYGTAPFVEYTWVPIIAPLCGGAFAVGFYELLSRCYDEVDQVGS